MNRTRIFYAKKDCGRCHGDGEFSRIKLPLGTIEYGHPVECDCWMVDAVEDGYSADIDDGNYEVHPHPSKGETQQ